MCNAPVGLGAKRTLTFLSDILYIIGIFPCGVVDAYWRNAPHPEDGCYFHAVVFRLNMHPAFFRTLHVWRLICAKLPFLCLTSKLFHIKGRQAIVKPCLNRERRKRQRCLQNIGKSLNRPTNTPWCPWHYPLLRSHVRTPHLPKKAKSVFKHCASWG